MLAVERRRADHLYFFDVDDVAFFSATVHQPEDSDGFEVSIQLADLGNGPVANFSYLAPTLYASGQIVTSEYHVFAAIAEESTLVADYWLDQLLWTAGRGGWIPMMTKRKTTAQTASPNWWRLADGGG